MRRIALLVGVLLLAGCGGEAAAMDSTEAVCDDFAAFVRDGRPAEQRPDVVRGMGDLIGNADTGVQRGFEALTNTVNDPTAQPLADDAFAQSCIDAGWTH